MMSTLSSRGRNTIRGTIQTNEYEYLVEGEVEE